MTDASNASIEPAPAEDKSLTSAATVAGGTGEAMITLRSVDKFYGDFQALRNIDLVVGKQEVVVVIAWCR